MQKIAVYQPKVSRKVYNFKVISTIVFYISLFLLTFSDFLNAQFDMEQRSAVKVGVASGTSLAFVILVGFAFLIDREFRRLLLGKTGIVYGAVVIFYTWMGWQLFGNSINWIIKDLYVCLWLIGGLAMFRILANSYRPKIQLTSIIFISTVFIYYSISLQAERINALDSAGLKERITDSSAWSYAGLLIPLFGIALGVLCRQGWFWTMLTERGTRRLKSIYHKLFMVLALKSSPHHLSLINNNS